MGTDIRRVYILRDRISKRGPLYTARFMSPDGEIVATNTLEPALAAARSLIARGYDPKSRLEMWDGQKPFPRLSGVLGVMARQTVKEELAGSGLRFVPYVDPQNRVCHGIEKQKEGFVDRMMLYFVA
jgi:hypothetical protein